MDTISIATVAYKNTEEHIMINVLKALMNDKQFIATCRWFSDNDITSYESVNLNDFFSIYLSSEGENDSALEYMRDKLNENPDRYDYLTYKMSYYNRMKQFDRAKTIKDELYQINN